MSKINSSSKLHVLVVTPPPTTGMTIVNFKMKTIFAESVKCSIYSVTNWLNMPPRLWRIYKHLSCFFFVLIASFRSRGRDSFYFVPESSNGLFFNLFFYAIFLKFFFKKIILHHHVFSYLVKKDVKMMIMLKIIGDKAQHIFLGDEMMEAASNNYKIFSYHIINNTLMVDRIAKMNFASNLKKIGFLGNITEEKGVLLFLDTIKKVNACNINVSWVLAGPIKDSKLKDKIIKSCSDARLSLSWLGPVYGKEKEAFFREIDLLLFPSLYKNEAQPLTIYEAMAQGIPVLATPKGSIPSQIDSKHCIISEDHFAKQASRMIKDWHNDTSAFNKERTAVLETFESSLDDCALSIKSLLESI